MSTDRWTDKADAVYARNETAFGWNKKKFMQKTENITEFGPREGKWSKLVSGVNMKRFHEPKVPETVTVKETNNVWWGAQDFGSRERTDSRKRVWTQRNGIKTSWQRAAQLSALVISEPLYSSKVCERLHVMGAHTSPQYTQSDKTEKEGVAGTVRVRGPPG